MRKAGCWSVTYLILKLDVSGDSCKSDFTIFMFIWTKHREPLSVTPGKSNLKVAFFPSLTSPLLFKLLSSLCSKQNFNQGSDREENLDNC